ncbi:MAG: putative zinc-binding metallopeptidase [Hyphomicrobiaceae bacterium]
MKTFACSHCANKVYFENAECVKCRNALGFDARTLQFAAIAPDKTGGGMYRRVDGRDATLVRYCANSTYGVCNWLADGKDAHALCPACNLNRTIPNLNENGSLAAWGELERAKKRLIYSLLRFRLPFEASASNAGPLTFDFVRDALTGHLDGVITIDITEADAVERERQRQVFQEPYRSLLGHLRHESGHFYWMVLVEAAGKLDKFRALFGDERQIYSAALALHHVQGPPGDWQARHVSSYASCHPWEDWAETWAHYLHMVDALDTAQAEGMEPRVPGWSLKSLWLFKTPDVYRRDSFASLMARWVPLTISLNSLSRSMGHNDFYPFVISTPAEAKLEFVHSLIRGYRR